MVTNDEAEDGGGTALTLAVIGGGAVLLWLFLRGKGWGGHGSDDSRDAGRSDSDSTNPAFRRPVCIWVLDGDHIELNGVRTDLATTVAIALTADAVHFHPRGDARHGFVVEVGDALARAGIAFHRYASGSGHGSCPSPVT